MKLWNELSPAEKAERAAEIVRVLEDLTPAQRKHAFDMSTWGEKNNAESRKIPGCGTAACAAGWCGLDPTFRKNGFRMRLTDYQFTVDPASYFGYRIWNDVFMLTEDQFPTVLKQAKRVARDMRTVARQIEEKAKAEAVVAELAGIEDVALDTFR